tara:strand:- start:2985 stop:3218 length:234 start_codon:yes stop_codon:yes gene_type:complete
MITYIFLTSAIVIFVIILFIAAKAIKKGMNAKSQINFDEENHSQKNISNELEKVKLLYEKGILSEDEFKKAKEKILN